MKTCPRCRKEQELEEFTSDFQPGREMSLCHTCREYHRTRSQPEADAERAVHAELAARIRLRVKNRTVGRRKGRGWTRGVYMRCLFARAKYSRAEMHLVDVGQCGGLVSSGGERDHMADVHHVHEVSELELGKLFSSVAARADTDDADEAEAA